MPDLQKLGRNLIVIRHLIQSDKIDPNSSFSFVISQLRRWAIAREERTTEKKIKKTSKRKEKKKKQGDKEEKKERAAPI